MTTKPEMDYELRSKLTNTAYQKGLAWRNEKIRAVAEGRHKGISEEQIFKQLKMAGLIDATARSIMRDAHFFDDMTSDGLTEEEVKEELQEENEHRAELGKPKVSLEEWKKLRAKRKRPLEP